MSGFFAVRLAALDVDGTASDRFQDSARRSPFGSRDCWSRRSRSRSVFETTVRARPPLGRALRYLRHLARLRLDVLKVQVARSSAQSPMSRLRRLLAFGLVGLSGMVVNTLALWLLTDRIWDNHYLLAAVIATQVSTAWNLLWTEAVRVLRSQAGLAAEQGNQVLPAQQRGAAAADSAAGAAWSTGSE